MNNTLEKELNEYREDLQELTNSDLLIEYKYSCIEVERLRKLFRNNSDNKNLQNSLDYEKQIEKICMDNIISRMGVYVRNKILEQFPELLMPENCLEKLPDYGKTEDYIASIEVAYPTTWTVEYEMIDS